MSKKLLAKLQQKKKVYGMLKKGTGHFEEI